MRWEIGQLGYGNSWYRVGTSEGWNSTRALESWTEQRTGSIQPGSYGVRTPGLTEWQPFLVDEAGGVHGDQTDQRAKGAA